MLREALAKMDRADLIVNDKKHLIRTCQPTSSGGHGEGRRVSAKSEQAKEKE
jgi:hypothetical protein